MTQSYDNWLQEPYYKDVYCEECRTWYDPKRDEECECGKEYHCEGDEEWEE